MSASEQTSASKRKPGYYHIVFEGREIVAWWNSHDWFLPARTRIFKDDEFTEIDERRIERPSPQPQPDTQLKNINMNNVGTEIQHNEMTAEEKLQVVQSKLWEANREIESLRKEKQQQPDTDIPDWIKKYAAAGYTSSAGKAVAYLLEMVERSKAHPDTFVQDETQIVRGPLGPTYATKLVKGQPDELSKAQERNKALRLILLEWLMETNGNKVANPITIQSIRARATKLLKDHD